MARKNDVGNTGLSKSNVKHIKCYRCKQIGHYKNQCTNIENNLSNQKNKERMQSNAFSAVFLSETLVKMNGISTRAQVVHLTANESWVMNAKY